MLRSLSPRDPGSIYTGLEGPGFAGQPATFVRIAAADQNNLCTLFVGLSAIGDLWAVAETTPGGTWGKWHRLIAPPPS